MLVLMRRVEKRVYDSLRLRDHLLSLRLILRIGKFRAIEKRSRFYNARFQTGLVGFDMKLVTSILNDFAGHNGPFSRQGRLRPEPNRGGYSVRPWPSCSRVLTPLSNPTLRDQSSDALMWINRGARNLKIGTGTTPISASVTLPEASACQAECLSNDFNDLSGISASGVTRG